MKEFESFILFTHITSNSIQNHENNAYKNAIRKSNCGIASYIENFKYGMLYNSNLELSIFNIKLELDNGE